MATKYILMGVGGSGAKVIEAFTYLCAAGIVNLRDEYSNPAEIIVRSVDMDNKCGNRTDAMNTIESYREYADAFEPNRRFTKFANCDEPDWIAQMSDNDTLKSIIHHEGDDGISFLNAIFSGAYDDDETKDQNKKLNIGTEGRPNIGALIWGTEYDRITTTKKNTTYMQRLFKDIKPENHVKIMLVGSVIGGTGAGAMPTIVKKFYDDKINDIENKMAIENGRYTIGMCLMLPYFRFDAVKVEGLKPGDPPRRRGIDPQDLPINTQLALREYYNFFNNNRSEEKSMVDSAYIVGAHVQNKMRIFDKEGNEIEANSSTGSSDQNNPAMPTELAAALAIKHFFEKPQETHKAGVPVRKTKIVLLKSNSGTGQKAINTEQNLTWDAFPCKGGDLQVNLAKLSAFCLRYNHIIRSYAGESSHKSQLFKYDGNENLRNEIVSDTANKLETFCEYMLKWIKELELNGLPQFNFSWFDDFGHVRDIQRGLKSIEDSSNLDQGIRSSGDLGNRVKEIMEAIHKKVSDKSGGSCSFEEMINVLWELN